jgi:hypothetical protein
MIEKYTKLTAPTQKRELYLIIFHHFFWVSDYLPACIEDALTIKNYECKMLCIYWPLWGVVFFFLAIFRQNSIIQVCHLWKGENTRIILITIAKKLRSSIGLEPGFTPIQWQVEPGIEILAREMCIRFSTQPDLFNIVRQDEFSVARKSADVKLVLPTHCLWKKPRKITGGELF